ncbi:GerAB/ArcD/ProY family transporter [Paenibacillus paridis]|uniref:GerAB/ArcD/ProY family transporter n=1 Tax=Paenibacillus paridis TaxID=2583376 RepID=UPI0013916951|nr:endospore germination permease [Paenibacillus paridis]
MVNKDTLTVRTFSILVIFFTIGTSILITPAGLALEAKQDGWLAAILGVGLNGLTVLICIQLGKRHNDKTLIEMCHAAFGKWAGNVLGICFVLFFYLLAALMVGDLGYFLTTQNLPETPIEVLQIMFVVIIVFAVRAGLVVYSRAAQVFFPILICFFCLLILPILPKISINNFEPMLEYGFMPVVKAGFSFSGLQEMIVLLMLYPYVKKPASSNGGFMGGMLVGGIVLIVTSMGCIGVMGASVTSNQLFPAYVLAKNISIGHFLERIEGLMIFIWIMSIVMKIVITLDASVIGLGQLLKLKDTKPFIIPLGFGIVVLALLCYPNTIFIQDFLSKNWAPFASIFTLFLPMLLLVVLLLQKKKADDHPVTASIDKQNV